MKISIEVDWIEEGGDLNEIVKGEIIHGVKKAIAKDCLATMKDQSKQAFDEAVTSASAKISEKALEFADNWLENEVEITDKWGDKDKPISIKDLIKRNFDNLLERKVDSQGRFTDSYNSKFRLIEYLTNKRLEEEVETRMQGFKKDIDSRIKEAIEKSIKDNVSDRFAQMVIGAAKQDYLESKALVAETTNLPKPM